jgi:hypothetical protein
MGEVRATLSAHPREGGGSAPLGIVLQVWIPAFAEMSGVWLNPHPRQGGGMSHHPLI